MTAETADLVTGTIPERPQPVRVARVWPHQPSWMGFCSLATECHARLMEQGRPGEAEALSRMVDALASPDNSRGVFLAAAGPRPIGFLIMGPAIDASWQRVMWVQGWFLSRAPRGLRDQARPALLARLVFEAREQGVAQVIAETERPGIGRMLERVGFRRTRVTYAMEVVP